MAKKKKKPEDVISLNPPASEADTAKWAAYRESYDDGVVGHLDQVRLMVKELCAKATLAELRFRAHAISGAIEEGKATLEVVNEVIAMIEKRDAEPAKIEAKSE